MSRDLYIKTQQVEVPIDTDVFAYMFGETGLYYLKDKYGNCIVWYDKDADCKQVIQFPPNAYNEEIYTSVVHNTIKDDLEEIKGNTDYISDVLDNYEEMITTKVNEMVSKVRDDVSELREILTTQQETPKQSIGVKDLSDAVCDIIKAVK